MSDEPFSLNPKVRVLIVLHSQFDQRRRTLAQNEQEDVGDIIESLENRPESDGDEILKDTSAGNLWVRRKNNSYVMYRCTRNDPDSKFLVKCWVCGKYIMKNGVETYDIAG